MQVVQTIGLVSPIRFSGAWLDADGVVAIRRKLTRRYMLAFFQ